MKTHSSNWWFLALNGVIAILFGLLLLFFPKEAIETMVFYFGLVVLLSGLVMLLMGIKQIRADKKAGMLLFESVLTIAIGAIIMFFPQHSLEFFLIVIGVWAIILGVVQLILVVNAKGNLAGKNLFLFNGLITLAVGILLFFKPYALATFVVTILGVFSLLFGSILIYFAFAFRAFLKGQERV